MTCLTKFQKDLILYVVLLLSCTTKETSDLKQDFTPASDQVFFLQPMQLTAGQDSNFSSDLSPDGVSVVYTSDRKGNLDLWMKKTSGGFNKALTFNASDDRSPAISPDGKRLAFVSRRFDAGGDIMVMKMGGGPDAEHKSLVIRHKDFEDSEPAWFPGGQELIFASRKPGEQIPSIMTVNLDDLTPRPLGEVKGNEAAVFPDGKKIVIVEKGRLKLYDSQSHRSVYLTQEGLVQNGSPKVSDDGKRIIFSRYLDDTNRDGFLDADDHPTIWMMDLEAQTKQSQLENFLLTPLTSSAFAAWKPQERRGRIYFSMQTQNGLNLFYLPSGGQASGPDSPEDMNRRLSMISDAADKIYYLRRSASHFERMGKTDESIEASLSELRLQTQDQRLLEARWLNQKIRNNFSSKNMYLILAELMLIQGELDSPAIDSKPSEELLAKTRALREQAQSGGLIRAVCYADLVTGDIFKKGKKYSEAAKIWTDLESGCSEYRQIVAEAHLKKAGIQPFLGGVDAGIILARDMLRAYPDTFDLVQKASELAVELTLEGSVRPVADLHLLRQSSLDLPVLPALAHLKIGDIFTQEGKSVVAANEYRVMISLYPDSPGVLLKASEKLLKILLDLGRLDEAAEMMGKLYEQLRDQSPAYRIKARTMLVDVLGRQGEQLLRNRDFQKALTVYQTMEKADPASYLAKKGFLRILSESGTDEIGSVRDLLLPLTKDFGNDSPGLFQKGFYQLTRLDLSQSPSENLDMIDEAIESLEKARDLDDQSSAIFQALGWAYQQKSWWLEQYEKRGGIASVLGEEWNTVSLGSLADVIFDFRVLNVFRAEEPDWLELSIDSWLSALALSEAGSVERVQMNQNLAHAYYEKDLFKKSLHFFVKRIQSLSSVPVFPLESEALLWQRAARSAFQTDEMELAISLQRQSLNLWKKTGLTQQIYRAQDTLALSLKNFGSFDEAAELYESLTSQDKADIPVYNKVKALVNLSQCYNAMDRKNDALNVLLTSESMLTKHTEKNPGSWNQLLIIETIRSEILSGSGLMERLQQSLKRKIAILEKIRQYDQDENGKDEAWKALELSYAYNQSGFLAMKRGLYEQARNDFFEAFRFSGFLFPDKSKPAPPVWVANLINMSKIQIKQISTGYLDTAELKTLDQLLEKESEPWLAEINKPSEVSDDKSGSSKPAKAVPDYMPELLSSFGIIRSFLVQTDQERPEQGLKTTDPKTLLTSSLRLASLGQPDQRQFSEPWLSLNYGARLRTTQDHPEIGDIARQVRQLSSADTLSQWKYLMSVGLWKESLNLMESYVQSHGSLQRHDDRMLIREAFEQSIGSSDSSDFSVVLDRFKQYQKIRTWELFNRTFNKNLKVPELKPWQQQILSEKSLDTIQSSLEENELVLAVHQIKQSGKTLILWMSSEDFGLTLSDGHLTGHQIPSEANPQSVITQLLSERSSSVTHLLLIPSDESWDYDWEALMTSYPKISLSYFPGLDAIPVAIDKRTGNGLVFVTDSKDLFNQMEKEFSPRQHLLLDASADQKYPGLLAEVSHIYLSVAPLKLNRLDASHSHWRKSDQSESTVDHLGVSDISQLDLNKNSMMFFTRARYVRDDKNQYDLPEHWQSLWYGVYGSGGLSLTLPWASDKGENRLNLMIPEDLKNKIHAQGTLTQSLRREGVRGRVIGPLRKTIDDDEREDASDLAYESAEESLEEGLLTQALKFQSEYLWIKSISDEPDDYLDGLGQYALSFYRRGDYFQALRIQTLINQIHSSDDEGDGEIPGEGLMNGANFALLAKQYPEAGKLLDAAEAYYTEEEDFQTLGEIWRLRGIRADKEEKYSEAIKAYEMAKKQFEEEDMQDQVAAMLREIGVVYQIRLNDFEKALKYFQDSVDILTEEESYPALVKVLIEQANTYISMGQASRSLTIFNQALSYLSGHKSVALNIRVLQGQGVALFRAGRLSQIPQVLLKLSELIGKLPESSKMESKVKNGYLIDKINLEGMIFAKKGLWDKAFAAFDQGLELSRSFGFIGKEAFLLNNYGFWMRESGQSQKSLAYFEQAYKIDASRNIKKDIAYDLRNMGLSEVSLGHLESAMDHLKESLEISKKIGILYNLIYCHMGLGDLYRKQKDFISSERHYRSAAGLAAKSGLEDFMWKAVAAQGLSALDSGNSGKALEMLRRSVDLIESFNPGLQSRSSVSGLSSELGVQDVYDHLVTLYVSADKHLKALEYSERSKMRQVIDSIGHLDLPLADTKTRSDISTLKNHLVTLQLLNTKKMKATGENKKAAELEYQSLKNEIVKLMTRLKNEAPKAWSLFRVSRWNSDKIQNGIQSGTSLINYHLSEHQLFIWVITGDKIEFRSEALKRDVIERVLSDYQLIIENYSAVDYLSQELYRMLIRPVRDLISDSRMLGIVPHRWLGQLSFASLKDGEQWFIDNYELYYLELMSDQADIPETKFPWSGSGSRILALVNPDRKEFAELPFAQKEAEAIRFAFSKTKIYSGREARADIFLKMNDPLDILHLGVHGTFDKSAPAQSALYFSPDSVSNGVVKASGLFGHEKSPYLVVLSACESGRSDTDDGEPFVSLTRSFFYGGTKSLLNSLWRIDDVSSAMIMKRFYRNMASGDTLGKALQKSQKTVRKYFPHPVFWAAFKLNGSFH